MVDSGNSYGERVSRLVGWGHWFAFFNIVASMLIGTRYIVQSPWPETLMGQFYLAVSWVGHFGFLVFALYLLVLFPLTFVLPSRKLFRLVAVIFATVGQTVLLIDTQASMLSLGVARKERVNERTALVVIISRVSADGS